MPATVLIQAVGMGCQAAIATPVVSTAVDGPDTGGLLQSPGPTHGYVTCTTATTMSSGPATIEATAYLLVASGIKFSITHHHAGMGVHCIKD